MRKKFLLMTFLLAIIGFCGTNLRAQGDLQIATEEELRDFANAVNSGVSYAGQSVTLTDNITLTSEWTPIGNGARSSKTYTGYSFKGTFDGGNKTISGLTITSTSGADAAVGLFGIVDGGKVKNLNLTDVNINVTNSDLAGAAIGMMLNGATADNITVSGAVTGYDGVGGIVGRLIIYGTISNCTNNASVTSSYGGIGGIVGKAYYEDGANTSTFASIKECINTGTITAPMYVGGIVGLTRADVTNCVNEGAVVGGTQTGGIVGQLIAAGTVSGNENKAKVSGKNHLGGIIGDYSQSSAYTYYNVSIANNINRGELAATEQCAAIMGCNNIDGFTAMTATGNVSYYYVEGLELFGNPEDMVIDATNKFIVPVAKIDDVEYSTLAEAAAAAKSGDEIVMLSDVTLDAETILPAGVIFNGNGKQVNGTIIAGGEITFKGVTKAASFNVKNVNTVVNIPAGASLQLTGTGMVIGHGCTFNITGSIADHAAKTADKATLTPSLVMPGASFTGAGVTFNVTNAYISAPSSYCSSSSSASGTFDFNITNSIWESAGKLAFESQSTAATVNFDLVESVLNTGSHLVFGISRGEVVIDNSNVNVGTSRQIENQSTMTIKNGSVVNGAVATSSNAKNPGTLIVDNATYDVTGEFSGSDLGTGTLIVKKGATVSAGSITKANIQIDATDMTIDDEINLTANLANHAGTLEVINNDNLDAEIKDGKIVLVEKPVAKIGDTYYKSLQEALNAAAQTEELTTIQLLAGTHTFGDVKFPATLKNVTIVGADNKATIIKDSKLHSADGNAVTYKGITFDGIVFDNSSILFTGAINGEVVYEDWTIKKCDFRNLQSTDGIAAIHFNLAADETIKNFTFEKNTITNVTSPSNTASGLRLNYVTGDVVIKDNETNNVAFNAVQIINSEVDNFTFEGNILRSNGSSLANLYNVTGENIVITKNQFLANENQKSVSNIAYADVSGNYWGGGAPTNLPEGVVYSSYYTTVESDGTLGGLVELPQGNDFTGYTRGDAIWGEVWGNATESFVIKVLDANGNVMGTTSLNNIGGIINGNVNVTWSLKLDADSNTDKYWTMEWTTAPTIDNMPAKVELWVDGVKVSCGNVVLNGPDEINKIYAAVTDADGKIYSYHMTIQDAIDAITGTRSVTPNVIALLRNTDETVTLPAGITLNLNGFTAANVSVPVAKIGETPYYTLAEAVEAAQSSATITLLNGEHELPVFANKELTFKGESKDGVIVNDAPDARAQGWNGSTFHFENLTAKGATANYHGLANGVVAVTYNNCNINGLRFLYATEGVSFDGCAFNANGVEHSFWTYGASNVTVTDCTFTYTDRAVNCYSENGAEHELDITFTGCTFTYNGTNDAPEGAVEINSGSVKSIELVMNDCTAPAKGAMWFNSQWDSKKGENTVVTIDDIIVWQVLPVAKIGDVQYKSLQAALDAAAAGTGNVTVEILEDINLTGIDWNPVTVSAPNYPVVTVNGNDYTITGLNDMLFAGTWAGGSGLIINDLTIANSNIVNDKDDAKGTVGVGAFIGFPQASATITLNNCHLKDSKVEGGHWTGGLIGYAAGYAGTDGPVFMELTITGCSVTGSTITGEGSVGGIIGHGSGNAWTNVVIENTTVSNNTITSTGSSNVKAGAIMGTIGAAGQPTTVNGVTHTGGATVSATVSGNTVKSNNVEITTIYGCQGTSTGMLELAGGSYDNYPIEENVAYAAPAEGYEIVENTNGTYGVEKSAVAMIGDVEYKYLQAAFDAAQNDATIMMIADVTVAEEVIIDNTEKAVTLDMNGKTWNGAIKPSNAKLTIKNGTINNENVSISAIEITYGELNLNGVNIASARHAVRIDGDVEATINGGTYKAAQGSGKGTYHAANISGNANVTIEDGTFVGPKGTSADSGSAVKVQSGATVTIKGGDFSGGKNHTLSADGNLIVKGGTFDQDPSAYKADDYTVQINKDGKYEVLFAVAMVETTYYADLHEAMVAAKSGETVKLVNDVDLAGTEWEPVSFKGIFDGQDHTISNLTINKPGVSNTGFIKSLNGTFKNVTFTNPTVTGGENTAVVAGRAGGAAALAENITINGTIKVETTHSGYARAGGIVGGWAYGNYKNITVDGGDKATSYIKHTGGGDGRYVAGIVGHADDVKSYTNCTVKNITISGGWLCGGIAGPGPSDDLASGCSVENIDMKADYSGGMFGWYYGNGTVKDATVKNVTFTDGSTNNGIIGGYGQNTDANVENLTYENVQNSNGAPLLDHVASIGNNHYFTFEAALDAVQNGETIILLGRTGDEKSTEIEFTEEITFTITGNAPNYALPIITFQNATVNIEDANFQIPELDARQNATINVINSTIVDAGGNSIVKSYYNGAINIDANSTVYAMQVTTMGYITVAGTLNATWQTNVYGNGLITLNEGATFKTAALHLTAQDYSGRDNTDADRVGKPAEIVVDGANFTVGNVHSAGDADYSYNSSKGINVGTVEGKSAILNIKNGGNVNIHMANGETANIGAGGTVNVAASTLNTFCRAENGTVTLANNGTVYVTGAAKLAAANVTGAGWFYMNGVALDADTKLSGAKVGFINGENTIVGSTIDNGFFSVGIGQNAAATTAATFAEANGITLDDVTVNVSGNAIIGGNGETYSGWVGSAYSADKTQYTYTLNVVNSLAAFGYMHVSKDGAMTINGHSVNKYTHDNANVDFYAGDFIVNGNVAINNADAWVKYTKMSVDHADGVLNITGGTNYESSIHNGSTTGTSLVFHKAGKVNIDATSTVEIDNGTVLVEGAVLNIASNNVIAKGTVTGNGTINLTHLDAKFTAQEGLTVNNGVEGNTDYGVTYVNGAYQFAQYVAQIGDNKYLTLQEAINAVENGNTITLIGTAEFAENILAGNENLKPLNKVFTIDGDDHVVTGNWRFGRDDHNTDLSEITIKNVNFKGNGISILDFYKVTISECTFNDITTGNAIYVSADEYTSSIVVENCEMNNIEGAGINFRNPVNATVKGNKIIGTGNNSITFQHGTAYTEAETGEYIIENNIFQNWANEASEGRALRIATGVKPRAITIENNVMIKDNAPEEFVKVTGNTDNVSVDENYWNGANPTSSNTPAYFLAEGVQVHNYYAAYDAETNTLSDLVTIEGAGETFEIFYTAAGEVTEQANAAYSLMFTVTDYASKEVSVKIGSKKPVQNSAIHLVTPETVEFDNVEFDVTSVANSGFNGTSFKKVTISEGVETIGNNALYFMTKLTELVLPSTLASVGEQCIGAYNPNSVPLKSIVCYAEEAPSAFEPTSNASFQTCVEQQTMLIVPNAADYTVYSNASGWKFTNILGIGSTKEIAGKDDKYTLLATVTSMNPMECSIQIGNTKPASNSNAELVIPESVEFYDGFEFTVTSIPNNAFSSCLYFVGDLVIPQNVRTIGAGAFNTSHFVANETVRGTLTLNEGLVSIGSQAFKKDYFKGDLSIPSTVETIASNAFQYASFDGILTINGNIDCTNAFGGTEFTELVLVEGVEEIKDSNAFSGMLSLKEVVLPSTLQTVGMAAFKDDDAIEVIHTYATEVPAINSITGNVNYKYAFSETVKANAVLYVHGTSYDDVLKYKNATNEWKEFQNIHLYGAVAQIEEVEYLTIQDAINAAQAGETITVIDNVELTETITVAADKEVVFDLNGKVVSYTTTEYVGEAMITNNSNLTINDSAEGGKLSYAYEGGANSSYGFGNSTIENKGVLTINAGTVENTSEAMSHASYAINTGAGATLNVEGGNILNLNGHAVRMVSFGTELNTVNINGGYIEGTRALQVQLPGSASSTTKPAMDLNITGGELKSNEETYNLAIYVFSNGQSAENVSVEISGGTFNGNVAVNAAATNSMLANAVAITDGTFNGDYGVFSYSDEDAAQAVISITGGTFATNYSEWYAEDEQYVFELNENGTYSVVEQTIFTQTTQLNTGWNWFSYYVNTDLAELEEALGENGVQITSKTDGFVAYNSQYGWSGILSSITESQMYMINVGASHDLELSGELVGPTSITLHQGWNWIGFPMSEAVSVTDALAGFGAKPGDQIKSKDNGFASYNSQYGWGGTLSTLNPGEGYMYQSNNSETTELFYSAGTRGELKANVTTDGNHWIPNAGQYPNNMTMTAMVEVEGGDYEVAAFVDGEVRGSARPIYVEALDAHILFLTIHGDETEEMTFRYYDIATGEEYELNDRINYSNDAIVGSLKEPYIFNRGTTGIGEASLSDINIYPNPTTTGTEINLQSTCDTVEVFNALGVKVAEYHNVDSIDAFETAGIYVIRITDNGDVKHCRLIVK